MFKSFFAETATLTSELGHKFGHKNLMCISVMAETGT